MHNTILSKLAGFLADVGTVLVYLCAGLILYDVCVRLAFGQPFAGTADLVASALVLVTFMQGTKALLQNRLLQVTLLLDKLPQRVLVSAMALANLVGTALFACLVWMSLEPIEQALRTQEFYGTDAFRLPIWPLRAVVAGLWIVLALGFLAKAYAALRGKDNI
ncbi:MAG: TRAP transporter small permease subunit [Qingshengfaniella sp.]